MFKKRADLGTYLLKTSEKNIADFRRYLSHDQGDNYLMAFK